MNDANTSMLPAAAEREFHPRSDWLFYSGLAILSGVYIFLVVAMLLADASYAFGGGDKNVEGHPIAAALANPKIQYAIKLSLISCSITTILSLWVAVPIGYLMSRFEPESRRGRLLMNIVDGVLDIPIVLPPLVVGLCLLILFCYPPFSLGSKWVVYEIPAVILAQFMVACAFAVRTMRTTFDQIPLRQEQVAMTLGCSRGQAFWNVVLPRAGRGMVAAATLAWARSLGEFGPILIFAGSTRMVTEVLPTTVFLEMQAGHIHAAAAVSMIMVAAAIVVLVVARALGLRRAFY
jgi:molybdate transport system permease protein